MWRILPGPVWFALWCATAVSAPLVWFALTEPAEAVISESPPVLWWAVCATLVLSAVTAARCRVRYAGLNTGSGLLAAVAAGVAVAVVYLCLTLVVYRWIIPLREPPGMAVLAGVPLAAAAAAIGFALGRRPSRSGWPALIVAAGVAVLGALITPLSVQRGAEFSFGVFPPGGTSSLVGGPEVVTLPAAGRWGIYAIGSAPADPDCRVAAQGGSGEPADRIPIPPAKPGADTVPTYRWVAQFDVPAPASTP